MKLCNLIEGLKIVAKYEPFGNNYICAEHDEIFVGTDEPMSDEDNKRMIELGFHPDDNADNNWQVYV